MASFVCPSDGTVLVPVERQGIEIDHCPSCRGVWLDRGELDKIIERSGPTPEPYREARPAYDPRPQHHGGHHSHKRRKSFFEELFD